MLSIAKAAKAAQVAPLDAEGEAAEAAEGGTPQAQEAHLGHALAPGDVADLLEDMPPTAEWSTEECCTWLNAIGMGRYCEPFREHGVTFYEL